MFSGHDVTREFERELCAYTGAKYAVTTTSCTMAIQIACARWKASWDEVLPGLSRTKGAQIIYIPRRTYVGVPASMKNAGLNIGFVDEPWEGTYKLLGTNIWDSARRFTGGMFDPGTVQCVSFHWAKTLGLSQGGAILHDNDQADEWMRRYRFDGRREGVDPKDDDIMWPSVHAYLSPEVAAHGLMKLATLPRHNADLPNSDYPDCSLIKAFR